MAIEGLVMNIKYLALLLFLMSLSCSPDEKGKAKPMYINLAYDAEKNCYMNDPTIETYIIKNDLFLSEDSVCLKQERCSDGRYFTYDMWDYQAIGYSIKSGTREDLRIIASKSLKHPSNLANGGIWSFRKIGDFHYALIFFEVDVFENAEDAKADLNPEKRFWTLGTLGDYITNKDNYEECETRTYTDEEIIQSLNLLQ